MLGWGGRVGRRSYEPQPISISIIKYRACQQKQRFGHLHLLGSVDLYDDVDDDDDGLVSRLVAINMHKVLN